MVLSDLGRFRTVRGEDQSVREFLWMNEDASVSADNRLRKRWVVMGLPRSASTYDGERWCTVVETGVRYEVGGPALEV
jgi:hypothetical protein